MVEILDETSAYPSADALAADLTRLMAALGVGERDLTVVLCDDTTIRRLNREHRGEDSATDVLSYPLWEPDDVGMPEVAQLGDIVISLETAAKQGEEHGHGFESEVRVLAAHGLVHLMGYDHLTEEAWQRFTNAQELVLELAEL